jgi:alpha-mannosidase
MGGQFHDVIPGTSLPKAYEYSWNDEVLAMNQFAGVLTSATEAVASGLNTEAKGTAVVVYNPLNISREDVVEAQVSFPNGTPKAVRVIGPEGKEVPAQLEGNKVVFVANAPSVGYAVYDVQAADAPAATMLKVTESSLENARYRVTLDKSGDVASIFDKKIKKELLASPLRLAFKTDKPSEWPAWNMDWADQQKAPRAYVGGPVNVRVVEQGPARVALEVTREAEGSKFAETIRLAAGDAGNRVEFSNAIDWHTAGQNVKAMFPLTAANSVATYNLDLGAIQRANDDEKKFEVVAHQWFDLTDKKGTFGVTVLSGAKNGSNKPNDNTLGLTLLRTPGISEHAGYEDQATQDWGHHEFTYGLASHAGDLRREQTYWQGFRLDAPLVAFESTKHSGPLGKSFSLLHVNNPRVRVLAVKKAEESDEVIVRLVELDGKPQQNVRVTFAGPIASAREVNGQELLLGAANVDKGELVTSFAPYEPRTFAVTLGPLTQKLAAPTSMPVALTYDRAVATPDGRPGFGAFDSEGRALPAEMLPTELKFGAVDFKLAPATNGHLNAVVPMGQTIALPEGPYNKVYILAASAEGDQKATFKADSNAAELTIPSWTGYVGQWDNRLWKNEQFAGLTPGFVKTAPVAWFASHRHDSAGANEPYAYSYLYAATLDLAPNSRTLTLPKNDNIRILAVTVADESEQVRAAQPLYDTLQKTAGETMAATH